MKTALRLFLPALLLLGFATQIGAQDPCSVGCDPFYQYYDPDANISANVYGCQARAAWGGYCVDCVKSMTQPNLAPMCVNVTYSASCNCDSGKCAGGTAGYVSGHCTYYQ